MRTQQSRGAQVGAHACLHDPIWPLGRSVPVSMHNKILFEVHTSSNNLKKKKKAVG